MSLDSDEIRVLRARIEESLKGFYVSSMVTQVLEQLDVLIQDSVQADEDFDLRWKADQRAIKRWQEATGKTRIWPDHADLCVWLLEQLERNEALLQMMEEAVAAMEAAREVMAAISGDSIQVPAGHTGQSTEQGEDTSTQTRRANGSEVKEISHGQGDESQGQIEF